MLTPPYNYTAEWAFDRILKILVLGGRQTLKTDPFQRQPIIYFSIFLSKQAKFKQVFAAAVADLLSNKESDKRRSATQAENKQKMSKLWIDILILKLEER